MRAAGGAEDVAVQPLTCGCARAQVGVNAFTYNPKLMVREEVYVNHIFIDLIHSLGILLVGAVSSSVIYVS